MTDVYVDSSALLKRVFIEAESSDLREVLRAKVERGDLLVSSDLTWVEVSRAIMRAGVTDVDDIVTKACSGIARFALDPAVLKRAERIGPTGLRSLDAIHLASATSVGATEMLTYDVRLAEAARSLGLKVVPETAPITPSTA